MALSETICRRKSAPKRVGARAIIGRPSSQGELFAWSGVDCPPDPRGLAHWSEVPMSAAANVYGPPPAIAVTLTVIC